MSSIRRQAQESLDYIERQANHRRGILPTIGDFILIFTICMGLVMGLLAIADNAFERQNIICQEGC